MPDSSREGRIFFNNLFGFSNILGGDSDSILDDVSDTSSDDDEDREKTRNCTCGKLFIITFNFIMCI